jgi:hypothetical protein
LCKGRFNFNFGRPLWPIPAIEFGCKKRFYGSHPGFWDPAYSARGVILPSRFLAKVNRFRVRICSTQKDGGRVVAGLPRTILNLFKSTLEFAKRLKPTMGTGGGMFFGFFFLVRLGSHPNPGQPSAYILHQSDRQTPKDSFSFNTSTTFSFVLLL